MRKLCHSGWLVTCILLLSGAAYAQTKKLSGRVTDEKSIPLAGVSVKAVGTKVTVQTDNSGNFAISFPERSTALEFTFIGYNKKEIPIGNSLILSVQLELSGNILEEVVIGAQGIKAKKKEQGFAQTSINTQQLTEAKPVNLVAGLTAKVAGLQVNSLSGGVNPTVRAVLRGNRSLLGDNTALIVVDNVVVPSSILGNLNPEDVEDVNILNGAGAAALYGSDASNGAIIITTKKGKPGMSTVKLSNTTTLAMVSFYPELQDRFGSGYQGQVPAYVPYENQQYGPAFDGSLVDIGRPLKDGRIQKIPYSPVNDRKDFWETGVTNQTDLAVSSGDERSTSYVAVQYVNVKGVTWKDKYNRFSVRANGTRNVTRNFKVTYKFNYVQNRYDQTSAGGTIYQNLLNTPAHVPLTQYKDWVNDPFANPQGYYNDYYQNPYFYIGNNRSKTRNDYLTGNLELNWKPIKWLDLVYRAGITTRNQSNKSWVGKFIYDQFYITGSKSNVTGSVSDGAFYSTQLTSDFLATASQEFGDFNLSLTLANHVRSDISKGIDVSGSGLVVDGLYNVSNRLSPQPGASESNAESRQYAVYGRFKAGYKDFLFLEATGRNDWVSVLDPAHNSFFYPAVSMSFIPQSAFPVLKTVEFVNNLKLRAGWSQVGNINIGAYALNPTFGQANGFPYSSGAGFTAGNTIVARDLKPEITNGWEFGFDGEFYKNRITAGLTYYSTATTDQTVAVGISTATGFSSFRTNTGEVTNKGLEALLHVTPIKNTEWELTVGGNFTWNENKVVSINSDLPRLNIGSTIFAVEGLLFPVIIGTDYLRDPQNRIIVDRKTGYPSADPNTKVLGNTNPKERLGLDFTLKYKNLRLWALGEFRGGFVIFQNGGGTYDFSGSSARSVLYNRERFVIPNSSYEDPAKPGEYIANTNIAVRDGGADFWTSSAYNTGITTNYITKGNFWKLREVSLTYTVPRTLLQKTKVVKDASISIQGRNLLIFTPKSNVYTDPEYNFSDSNTIGITTFGEPPSRYVGATISLTF
jgi:TonB-linked SusC/RagA family outer membrane protein